MGNEGIHNVSIYKFLHNGIGAKLSRFAPFLCVKQVSHVTLLHFRHTIVIIPNLKEEHMKPSYEDALAYYGVGGAHPGGLALTKELLRKEPINGQTRILDAGCGTGQTSAYLAKTYGCKVTAIDLHPIMIRKAKQRMLSEKLPVKVLRASTQALPFPDQSFDFILSESVTVFTNIARSLKEYFRVLKPAGVLIATEMAAEPTLTPEEKEKIKEVYSIKEVLDEKSWVNKLRASGFRSVRILRSEKVLPIMKFPLAADELPEFNISPSIDPQMDQIIKQHQKVTALFSKKLGYRVFRAVR